MGRINSRLKGIRAERQVIDLLQPIVDEVYAQAGVKPGAVPTLQRNTLQSDFGGYDIVGLPWLALEVKHVEVLALDKWWEQTLRQAVKHGGSEPVLIYRSNRVSFRVRILASMIVPRIGDWHQLLVDISLESFLQYFDARCRGELHYELQRQKK